MKFTFTKKNAKEIAWQFGIVVVTAAAVFIDDEFVPYVREHAGFAAAWVVPFIVSGAAALREWAKNE